MDWSRAEVEMVVADYLKMLSLELAGQTYSKAAHRRVLLEKLNSRSAGSVEFKHCNISAVLIHLGCPYLRGYQPRANYQRLLREVVELQVDQSTALDSLALAAAHLPAVPPEIVDFSRVETEAPLKQHRVGETSPHYGNPPVKRDYLAIESRNRSLGQAGEEFVFRYEQWRLAHIGKRDLAERVEHVSQTKGDGLGYDILSFDANGRERFIEVKTTAFGKDTPFFLSKNELHFSRDAGTDFTLCRLFEFRQTPKLFSLKGALDQHCDLDPVTYRASFS